MKAGEVYVGRKTQKNRTSILKSDGETIKEKEAREDYGFKHLLFMNLQLKQMFALFALLRMPYNISCNLHLRIMGMTD